MSTSFKTPAVDRHHGGPGSSHQRPDPTKGHGKRAVSLRADRSRRSRVAAASATVTMSTIRRTTILTEPRAWDKSIAEALGVILLFPTILAVIAQLLPLEPMKPKGGQLRSSDRAALANLVRVLRTGMQCKHVLYSALGRSGKASWRWLGAWQAAGI